MHRREFLQHITTAGAALAGAGFLDYAMPMPIGAETIGEGIRISEGLDLLEAGKAKNLRPQIRPEITRNPRAVFLIETHVEAAPDDRGFFTAAQSQLEAAGKRAASLIFVKGAHKGGSTIILPNFASVLDKVVNPTVGIMTSPDFIAGFVEGLRELGSTNTLVGERGGMVEGRRKSGVYDIFNRHDLRLIEAAYSKFSDYASNELNWHAVPGKPAVWKRIPTFRPIGDPDNFFINMPKLKAHNLGLTTLSVKNLQGSVATGYGHYCNRWQTVEYLARRSYMTDFDRNFVPNYYQNVENAFLRHRAAGFKYWDFDNAYPLYEKKGGWKAFRKIKGDPEKTKEFMQGIPDTLMYDEMWCQRALDSATAIVPDINIVEGIIGRDGSGFDFGRDYLCNYIVVGLSKIEVDTVASHLMGQNPQELFYTRIAKERGLGENNPEKIKINVIRENGEIEPLKNLSDLRQAHLGVNLHSWSDKGKLLFW